MAVSHAIAALEARHETKLFDCIGRRIALTEACRVFLMEARAILARAGAAELAQSEFGTLKRGTLCVQASQMTAGYTLPRHLVAFQRAYPRLWIQRPSSERRRDFNPPIHTLPSAHYEPLTTPGRPAVPHGLPVGFAHHAMELPVFRDVPRDRGVWLRKDRRSDNDYLVQPDALTNRVLFLLVTHGVPEDRRRRCGYTWYRLTVRAVA